MNETIIEKWDAKTVGLIFGSTLLKKKNELL